MRIAIAASEAAPFIKTGGLGDVMQALPEALAKLPGNTVCLFLPYYGKIKYGEQIETEYITSFSVKLSWRQSHVGLFRLKSPKKKLQVYFIDNEQYFNRGSAYGQIDDGERFAFYSKAVLSCLTYLDYQPHILQCNDWQTALIPLLLRSEFSSAFPDTKSVFTIHNIEYQGWAGADFPGEVLGLSAQWASVLQMGDATNFMKAAILTADAVSTVSKTYAQELQYPYFSHGMSEILASRADRFYGITNGIDTTVFDPSSNTNIPYPFHAENMAEQKARNKTVLQKELGLRTAPDAPLYAMVTRLVGHKGIDILCYICQRLMEHDVQLAIVGTGEERYERMLSELACRYPGKMAIRLTFSAELADRVYAGADAYLMPSRSEPCGLSQIFAMHFGTIPIVHATGGLKDTVFPYDPSTGSGRGFTFQSYNGEDFMDAILRSMDLYKNHRAQWDKLARQNMALDFSWKLPAQAYMDMFRQIRKTE